MKKKILYITILSLTILCLVFECLKFYVDLKFLYVSLAFELCLTIIISSLLFSKKTLVFGIVSLLATALYIAPNCIVLANNSPAASKTVLHAGGGISDLAYLNCQEIFDKALDEGQNLIEIDFLLSKDEQVICTHKLEYTQGYNLNNRPTYQQFNSSILCGKYHPLTLEHIFEQLESHKDAKVIFDSKESDKTKILNKIVENAKNNGFDVFDRMIVQIYSEKNYLDIKSDTNLAQFKEFWYTNYVSNMLPTTINAKFADKKDVSTYVMNKQFWLFFTQLGIKTDKQIAVHTINDAESIKFLEQKGVDLIFKDYF